MDLDWDTLSRIDRRLLAGLDQDESFRMVRVPVTEAAWSTWKRYCAAAGISMGRGIAVLIEHELVSALGETVGVEAAVLAGRAEEQLIARERHVADQEHAVGAAQEHLAAREQEIAEREHRVAATEESVRMRTERLRRGEAALKSREQNADLALIQTVRPIQTGPKIGRNERCRCGSGLKYKHCHGMDGR
jgi:hypothetical protein